MAMGAEGSSPGGQMQSAVSIGGPDRLGSTSWLASPELESMLGSSAL